MKMGMLLLSNMLRRFIKKGTLRVIDADGTLSEFMGTAEPVATIRLHDSSLPLKIFRNPELSTGEAYMDGTLTFEDCTLEDFLDVFSINRGAIASYPMQKILRRVSRAVRSVQQHNPIGKAQKNVAHHYDLSEEMYRLFLDEGMYYSCAYFEKGDETLEEAQENKARHIAAKLKLEDGQRILDIGCGWGGMALHLARRANVKVLGVTLSEEQHRVAVQRARDAGVSDRVHFELLHSIGHMSPPSVASPWLRKYIFPGAYSPALSETFAATERQHLWVSDVEVLRVHYADTLVEWNRRFQQNRDRIAEIYDERFCRMWEFYLLSAETMFRTGAQMVFQMQLSRVREASGLTRDYMFETEARYRREDVDKGR